MTTDARLPGLVETVLLDAGGVLLELDFAYVKRLVESRGVATSYEDLSRAEVEARAEIHRYVSEGGRVGDAWRDYFHTILGRVGLHADAQPDLIDSLWEAHQRFGLWTVATEGGPAAVAELKRRGYRIGVVSNAEGRVAQDLDAAGYREMFETVIDSHHVGVEKPDPAIFHLAMDRMDIRPETAIFVGDVPAVDVEGARGAGLAAVLIDRHDLYNDWDVLRLKSVVELPESLRRAGQR